MVKEVRRLIFSNTESTSAIKEYGKRNGVSFSEGTVIRAQFTGPVEYGFQTMKGMTSHILGDYNINQLPQAITLTFFDEKTMEQKYFTTTADFISSALIEYCLENKIMLPKEAGKDLDIAEFNICLNIKNRTQTEEDSAHADLQLADE